jgi:hypothetical protein
LKWIISHLVLHVPNPECTAECRRSSTAKLRSVPLQMSRKSDSEEARPAGWILPVETKIHESIRVAGWGDRQRMRHRFASRLDVGLRGAHVREDSGIVPQCVQGSDMWWDKTAEATGPVHPENHRPLVRSSDRSPLAPAGARYYVAGSLSQVSALHRFYRRSGAQTLRCDWLALSASDNCRRQI